MLSRIRRAVVPCLALVCLTLAMPSPARAQAAQDEDFDKGYTLPYFFAMVGVLGVVVSTCRPNTRKAELPEEVDY